MVIMPNNLDSQEHDSQIPTEDGSSKATQDIKLQLSSCFHID